MADRPDGEFRRLSDKPILQFGNEDYHIEDPFIWYDESRKKFCLIAKDDVKNGAYGITDICHEMGLDEHNPCI